MENLNAEQAKQIADSLHVNELNDILVDIKNNASKGDRQLHVYKMLKEKTLEVLKERGFRITSHDSIAIQRDNLYHSIYW